MKTMEVLALIRETLGEDCNCPKADLHIYRLALQIFNQTREDAAAIADAFSTQAGSAIRNN